MKAVRGLAGVAAGFLFFAGSIEWLSRLGVQWGNTSASAYLLLSVAWIVTAAMLAGYIAALLAGAHEFPWAASVGMLIVILAITKMRSEGASRPGWYHITLSGCGPISTLIGAAIRALTKPRQTANSKTSGAAIRR